MMTYDSNIADFPLGGGEEADTRFLVHRDGGAYHDSNNIYI